MSLYKAVPVFRPSLEEFTDFSSFISSIWEICEPFGMAKIVPPKGWKPSKTPYPELVKKIIIPTPVRQCLNGEKGRFRTTLVEEDAMTTDQFAKVALEAEREARIEKLSIAEQEEKFWKLVQFQSPLYGADMLGTLFDTDVEEWNPQKLGTLLDLIEVPMAGITQPYLYFGMWKAMFGWHTEDMDLCSINYVHYGKPKHWYCLPATSSQRFESILSGLFPQDAHDCKMFIRHKNTVLKPSILVNQYRLPVYTCVQEAGEFMITFPNAYHAGFNHGLNCAESVNFATKEWLAYGKKAKPCTCTKGMAHIDMDVFLAKYQLSLKYGKKAFTEDMIWDQMRTNGVNCGMKLEQLVEAEHEMKLEEEESAGPTKKRSSPQKPKEKRTVKKPRLNDPVKKEPLKLTVKEEPIENGEEKKRVILVINFKLKQVSTKIS